MIEDALWAGLFDLVVYAGGRVLKKLAESVDLKVKDCTQWPVGGKTGTIWDKIIPTQENYPNTNIPRSFEIEVNGWRMWTHGNATEHIYEEVYKKISTGDGIASLDIDLYTQELLNDFYGSLEQATEFGVIYEKKIAKGNWEFVFAEPRKEGELPVIKHAQFNGWH